MQMSLFEDVELFNEYGFTLGKTFKSSDDKKIEKLENTRKVLYKGKTILHLQSNDDGTFNTFSFDKLNFNITLEKSIEIAQEIKRKIAINSLTISRQNKSL